MALTPAQRAVRRLGIGSSDSPAIVGEDPHRTAYDVYLSKTQEVEESRGSEAIDMGNRVEPLLVAWAAEELGVEVQRDVMVHHPTQPLLFANLDSRVVRKPWGIEAKFTGVADEYGEPGSDHVPNRVLIQALHQMEVAQLERVYVPVLLARRGRPVFEMFQVERNERGQAAIVERDLAFWHDHVEPRIPPSGSVPSLDLLKRIRREPNKTVEVDPELVARWVAANEARKTAEREENAEKALLLAALGNAEAATFGEFGKWVTYYGQTRKEYVVPESTFRVLRMSKKP